MGSGIGLFLLLRSHRTIAAEQAPTQSAEGDETKPVAQVEVVPIQRKSISEKLTAYGSVVAQPGKTHFVAISFESRVQHILVSPGQLVKQGDTLLEVQGSPASLLQLHQAQGTAQEAQKELDQAKKRFEMKLATNQELNQAQKAAADADLQLDVDHRAIVLRPTVVVPVEDAWAYTALHRELLKRAHADSRAGRVRSLRESDLDRQA